MSQTFLDENPPMILNATCSFRHVRTPSWPAHATLRMDIRREVDPDIQADIRFMPFRDHLFSKVFVDLPHMIRKDPFIRPHDRTFRRRLRGRTSPNSFERYGHFSSYEEMLDTLQKADSEIKRVLRLEDGLTIWKWTYGSDRRLTRREDLDLLKSFNIIDEKIMPSRTPGSTNKVSYLTMRPKP